MSSAQKEISSEPMVLPEYVKNMFRKRTSTRAPLPPRHFHFVLPEIIPEESPPQSNCQTDGIEDLAALPEICNTSPEIPLQCDVASRNVRQGSTHDKLKNQEDKENRDNDEGGAVDNPVEQANQHKNRKGRDKNVKPGKNCSKEVESEQVDSSAEKPKKKPAGLQTRKRKQNETDVGEDNVHDESREPRVKRACVVSHRHPVQEDPPEVTPTSSQPLSKKSSRETGRVLFQHDSSQLDMSQDYTIVSTPSVVGPSTRRGKKVMRGKQSEVRANSDAHQAAEEDEGRPRRSRRQREKEKDSRGKTAKKGQNEQNEEQNSRKHDKRKAEDDSDEDLHSVEATAEESDFSSRQGRKASSRSIFAQPQHTGDPGSGPEDSSGTRRNRSKRATTSETQRNSDRRNNTEETESDVESRTRPKRKHGDAHKARDEPEGDEAAAARRPRTEKKSATTKADEDKEDSAADNQSSKYRLWQGEGEDFVRRNARSITDLDVLLNHFEEFALEYRIRLEDPVLKKVVNRVARQVQSETRKTILEVVTYHSKLQKLRQSERLLKKKRDELCELKHERQVRRKKLVQLRKSQARTSRQESSAQSA